MPTSKKAPRGSESPSTKDPELYEELLEDGASKQKAARIANAAATSARSAKKKSELLSALRNS